jgi:Tol biopolymer transport system component
MAIIMLIAATVPLMGAPAHADDAPPVNGRIAYQTQSGTILASPDGTDPIAVTSNHNIIFSSFSKDGTKQAYMSVQGAEEATVYYGNTDGSDIQEIADGFYPSISPDGNKVLYLNTEQESATWHVFDSNGQTDNDLGIGLLETGSGEDSIAGLIALINVSTPQWSPDSEELFFAEYGAGETENEYRIYKIASSGDSIQQEIVSTNSLYPILTSDGQKLLFFTLESEGEESTVVIQSLDLTAPSAPVSIISLNALEGLPTQLQISPDDSKFAVVRYNPNTVPDLEDLEISTYDMDGTNKHTIVEDGSGFMSVSVAWSPDSTKLAFSALTISSDEELGGINIYTANYDGSNLTKITNSVDGILDGAFMFSPTAWLPQSINPDDFNDDGTSDSIQQNVETILNPLTNKYVTLETDSECSVISMSIEAEATGSHKDSGFDYPNGLVNFELDCGTPNFTATINLYYPDTVESGVSLRKYTPATGGYATVKDFGVQVGSVSGTQTTIVTYQVTDGGELDTDNVANGVINDPVGLGKSTVGIPNTGISTPN